MITILGIDIYITPFGILDLTTDEIELIYRVKSNSRFHCGFDSRFWLQNNYDKSKNTLIINTDNGSENSSRRTQFIKRILEVSAKYTVKVILAYYPPYHSKYNPIERIWEWIEQHWNGDILDTKETVLRFAQSMTWKEKNPFVKKEIMKIYESILVYFLNMSKYLLTLLSNFTSCTFIIHPFPYP